MSKLLKHPRCIDFYFTNLSQTSLNLGYVTITAKYNSTLSLNILNTLKNIRKRSFYKAVEILSYLSDNLERDYILQILYSATTYIENNYSANLLKVWINDIRIKEVKKLNKFFDKTNDDSNCEIFIIVNLGFEYKDILIKKQSLW